MPGNIKLKQAATVALTVTNLHSLASSATRIAGWTSAAIDNRASNSAEYLDYLISGQFTLASANRQATGAIDIYIAAALNDTPTWSGNSSGTLGTEGAAAFSDTDRLYSLCRLLLSIPVTISTNGVIYTFPPTGVASLFNGSLPPEFAIFIAQNVTTTTTAGFAASGNAIYSTPTYAQYT